MNLAKIKSLITAENLAIIPFTYSFWSVVWFAAYKLRLTAANPTYSLLGALLFTFFAIAHIVPFSSTPIKFFLVFIHGIFLFFLKWDLSADALLLNSIVFVVYLVVLAAVGWSFEEIYFEKYKMLNAV